MAARRGCVGDELRIGTYLDPSYRFEVPLHDLPGCTSERRKSPDGCTRELEITCERSTCLETIVFSEDLSKYTGSVVCTGTYSGVDEDGTFECRTIVDGARNP